MKIEVLGPGCSKCVNLAANVKTAADKLGVPYELSKVTDLRQIMAYGVMQTPALVINGQVKVGGQGAW